MINVTGIAELKFVNKETGEVELIIPCEIDLSAIRGGRGKIMRKLETIQTKEVLNGVFAMDAPGSGGANHKYAVHTGDYKRVYEIQFQQGPRKDENSISGVIDGDLLEIVRDRLHAFQDGPFNSEYNAEALFHVEQALAALNRRVEDRIARDVLGKEQK